MGQSAAVETGGGGPELWAPSCLHVQLKMLGPFSHYYNMSSLCASLHDNHKMMMKYTCVDFSWRQRKTSAVLRLQVQPLELIS